MDDDADSPEPLAPGDAFAALGHEIRVGILEALAAATRVERPIAFADLRRRVGSDDSAKFNYHLGELVDHFVYQRDGGYDLTPAGKRVAEAVLSGAVTEDATLDISPVDESCPYCGAGVEASYRGERVVSYCPECSGAYDPDSGLVDKQAPAEYGFLGYLDLPPAGVQDRTPTEVHEAALQRHVADSMVASTGTCPRCSAPLDEWLVLCEDHERAPQRCDTCENRYAAHHSARCTNCPYDRRGTFGSFLLASTELQAFLTGHGVNLAAPDYGAMASVVMGYEEEIVRHDPFEAAFTFSLGGDALTLAVNDDFDVVSVERGAD